MNPAFSVIFFTTLTGAGYGMLFGLGMYQTRDFPLHREAALETLFAALAGGSVAMTALPCFSPSARLRCIRASSYGVMRDTPASPESLSHM